MQTVSSRASDLIEKNVKYDVFSRVLIDVELNGYNSYGREEGEGGQILFPASREPNIFPEDSVLLPRRPLGGLPKLIANEGRLSSTSIDTLELEKSPFFDGEDSQPPKIWWRTPSKDSNYKYFRTLDTAKNSLGGGVFEFDSPLDFIVEYQDLMRLNKLVLGFEYANALPSEVHVSILQEGSWVSIGSHEPDPNGLIVLSFNGDWIRGDEYSYEITSLEGIKLTISTMQTQFSGEDDPVSFPAVELIQISPRISIDISDRVISTSASRSSQEMMINTPIGVSATNTYNINISNNDGFFNENNQQSPMAGLVDVNVKFTIVDLIGGDDNEEFEEIPQAVAFSNNWGFEDNGTVAVECSDFGKFLQSRSMENSFYKNRDVRFVVADILERAEIVNYKIFYTQEDAESQTPYMYFEEDMQVWEALQAIATSEQAFFYFDEQGVFNWYSRDYWWSNDQVDYEILSRAKNDKLANLVSYSTQYTTTVNKITCLYYPTDFLKRGGELINNFLWEKTEPEILLASPLLSEINADSEYIIVPPGDFVFYPDEGIVNIDAEHIRYSKKPRQIDGPNPAIESQIQSLIQKVDFILQDVATSLGISKEEVDIIHVEKVLWPNSLLGRQVGTSLIFNTSPVQGFFAIVRAEGNFYQYNSSLTQRPFAVGFAPETEDDPEFSYWNLINDELVFTQKTAGYTPSNALFIEERGVFDSKKENHSFTPSEEAFTQTFRNFPSEIVSIPALAQNFVDRSNLKLRTNTIDPSLIHHYYPNIPSSQSGSGPNFGIYGCELKFPASFDRERGLFYDAQGIAGMFINQGDPGTGYYIELITTQYASVTEDNKREVRVWKFVNDKIRLLGGFFPEDFVLFALSLDELLEITGATVNVFPQVPYKLSVFAEKKQYFISQDEFEENIFDGEDGGEPSILVDGVELIIYLNGRRILSITDKDTQNNTIYTEGQWGVYARSNTIVDFEYIYAIDRKGDTALLDKSEFAIRDQINGGYTDNILEQYLTQYRQLRNEFVFDDFGSWIREVKEFDVNYEIAPALSAALFISNESKVYKIYSNLDQFSGKFALGNRTREFVVLSGDDPGTQSNMSLSVYGVPINQSESEEIKRKDERSVWRRGEEEIIIDSQLVQNRDKAERISDWTVGRWGRPSQMIEANVALDPRVQLGDLATMSIPEKFITEDQKFHVVAIEKSVGEAPSMTVSLRRAHF